VTPAVQAHQLAADPLQIRKLICWRDQTGKPSQLEAEWKSGQKTPV